jgi:hypothetical protein
MREVTTRGEDGWKSRSKGSSSWSASIAAAGRDGGGRAARLAEREEQPREGVLGGLAIRPDRLRQDNAR